ncbi:transposable element Tcb1 transposase [Trichonephila clavipes]|nr:transposable element Tcb1 transposase [Trichonephila clavipes]
MSCRKQRSAFDQVSEFDRGRIVTYRDCGLSFRKIGSRVGRKQTTVMRICNRWMQEFTHLSATPRCLNKSLETPWREDAEQLRYSPPRRFCAGYYGIEWYWISLSHSSSTHCRYFKQPVLHLRGVGANCPSLPSVLGHNHISTGQCATTRDTHCPKVLCQSPDLIASLAAHYPDLRR